jgi:hypothetical protein
VFINPDNKQTLPLGVWDIQEVMKLLPQYGYYSMESKTIFIPTAKNRFQTYEAFDIHRKNARSNANQPGDIVNEALTDVVSVDI